MFKWLLSPKDDIDRLLAQQDYRRAAVMIERRLVENPADLGLRRRLAAVLAQDDQVERAKEMLFSLVEDLASQGQITQGLVVLKSIENLDPGTDVSARLSRLVAGDPASVAQDGAGGQGKAAKNEVAFTTSHLVLSDWVEEARERDDFHWSPLFSNLTPLELREVFGELRLVVKHPGSIICSAGEPGASFFVLTSGAARVYRRDEQHRHHQATVLRGGDFFGIDSVLVGGLRRHTVTAASECELLEIERGLFERLSGRYPEFRHQLERIAAEMRVGL